MVDQRKLPVEFTVEELDMELIARGAQIPGEKRFKFRDKKGSPARDAIMAQTKELYYTAPSPNKALSDISTPELVKILKQKASEKYGVKGIWYEDDRMDFYEIKNSQIKKNTGCTAAICLKKDLTDDKKGFSTLRVKNYGKAFNLCNCESFYHQPAAAGHLYSGFLVKKDVIATAGHCADEKNVTDIRIVFGFKMLDLSTPVTRISNENIYNGVKIVQRTYNRRCNGADWALVKLDRSVVGQAIAKLSKNDIYYDQSVYVIGYPCGLPLKYAPGACVRDIEEACFSADLDVYSGNSGSPVFDSDTHEVIGMVVRGDNRDFRWAGKCWISVIYPDSGIYSREAQCTRVREFIEYCC